MLVLSLPEVSGVDSFEGLLLFGNKRIALITTDRTSEI